ncbi:MAG: hypothetical protein ABJB86_20085 [Bacteroidota bacterium]
MADTEQKAATVKKLTKKQAKKEVFEKLSGALAEYKNKLDKKKFENNLKKASKLFAVDLAKAFKKDRKVKSAKKTLTKK